MPQGATNLQAVNFTFTRYVYDRQGCATKCLQCHGVASVSQFFVLEIPHASGYGVRPTEQTGKQKL